MNIEEKNKMIGVLYEIEDERTRQNQKWGVQNHSPIEWIAILTEEVGEASKEALEYHFKNMGNNSASPDWNAGKLAQYRKELIQVAAVATQMVECLDRNHWHNLSTVCRGNCGMNYCDENGCSERKRNYVDAVAVSS